VQFTPRRAQRGFTFVDCSAHNFNALASQGIPKFTHQINKAVIVQSKDRNARSQLYRCIVIRFSVWPRDAVFVNFDIPGFFTSLFF